MNRKWRYTFSGTLLNTDIEEIFVSMSRPVYPFNPEQNTVTITYTDGGNKELDNLCNAISHIWNVSDYYGEGIIKIYDGCGALIETFILKQMSLESIHFEGGYSTSSVVETYITWEYKDIEYKSEIASWL